MTTRTRARLAWLAMVGLPLALAAGCASPQQAKAPKDDPQTLEEASAALERAERELHGLVLADSGAKRDLSADQAAQPAPAPPAAAGGVSETRASKAKRPDRCETACRALGSMDRAAQRLCALAGDGDTRCQGAEKRVGSARKLVRQTCPACGA